MIFILKALLSYINAGISISVHAYSTWDNSLPRTNLVYSVGFTIVDTEQID